MALTIGASVVTVAMGIMGWLVGEQRKAAQLSELESLRRAVVERIEDEKWMVVVMANCEGLALDHGVTVTHAFDREMWFLHDRNPGDRVRLRQTPPVIGDAEVHEMLATLRWARRSYATWAERYRHQLARIDEQIADLREANGLLVWATLRR